MILKNHIVEEKKQRKTLGLQDHCDELNGV